MSRILLSRSLCLWPAVYITEQMPILPGAYRDDILVLMYGDAKICDCWGFAEWLRSKALEGGILPLEPSWWNDRSDGTAGLC